MPFTKSVHPDPKDKCMGKMTVEGAHGRTSLHTAAGSQTKPYATSNRGQRAFVALSLGRGRKPQSDAVELFRAWRALDRKMPSPAAPPRAFPRVELMMVTLSITPRSSSVPLQKKECHSISCASTYQGSCSTPDASRQRKRHQPSLWCPPLC